jgi:hypothetical protein
MSNQMDVDPRGRFASWVVPCVLLGLSTWFFFANIRSMQHLPIVDEGIYYNNGLALRHGHMRDWTWSPLFAPVYAVFARPGADASSDILGTHLFLQSVCMLAFYFLMRAEGYSAVNAFALALGFSPFLVGTFSVYWFVALWLLVAWTLLRKSEAAGVLWLATAALVRPEFVSSGSLPSLRRGCSSAGPRSPCMSAQFSCSPC